MNSTTAKNEFANWHSLFLCDRKLFLKTSIILGISFVIFQEIAA